VKRVFGRGAGVVLAVAGGLSTWLAIAAGGARALAQVAPEEAPPAGVVTSLTLFAGTASGLWRSRDWGRRWERVEGRVTGVKLDSLGAARTILPLGPPVYAGGDGGFFYSEDFGETWERRAEGSAALCVMPSRYPQADATVFLGTATGLLKSEDAGRTFKPTPLSGTPVYRIEWPGPALVLATGRGVLFSPDSGKTFSGPGAGLPSGDVQALALSSFFAVDPVLFAGVGGQGVHRSSDGGKTWTACGLEGQTVSDLVWLGPFLYAAADQGVFRSEDAGKSWTSLAKGLPGAAVRRLLFPLAPAAGVEAFVGTDQGIYHTPDAGLHWQPSGLKDESILALATFPPPAPVLAGKDSKGKKK
jgi:photosystem II stability/assembly factor-like uncharacterized protein